MSALLNVLSGDVQVMIKQAMTNELAAQGHFLSGNLQRSLQHNVTQIPGGLRLTITGAGYAQYLDKGFKRASWKQVPFLMQYFRQRGLEEKIAKKAAFATVYTWMHRGGMPTRGSYRYAPNRRRLNFIDKALEEINEEVERKITQAVWEEISLPFRTSITKAA